ncbi:hypothetical protein EB796_014683 [Bugula neritina]|uniref:Uncharacterized protein n=1 Tax=Bugula neritina TaxID=10212 RepID=A0A7J7JL66_BUGNE|nr:hypothetical protein EB796_014683 [Bugula neritina]
MAATSQRLLQMEWENSSKVNSCTDKTGFCSHCHLIKGHSPHHPSMTSVPPSIQYEFYSLIRKGQHLGHSKQ